MSPSSKSSKQTLHSDTASPPSVGAVIGDGGGWLDARGPCGVLVVFAAVREPEPEPDSGRAGEASTALPALARADRRADPGRGGVLRGVEFLPGGDRTGTLRLGVLSAWRALYVKAITDEGSTGVTGRAGCAIAAASSEE